MKGFWKIIMGCLGLLVLTACGASKNIVKDKTDKAVDSFNSVQLIRQVEDQAMEAEFITAKMKFNLRQKGQDISVGGNLKMKKDDVIQLSLVAFGLVEAARIELTKDEVLVLDRINKRYVRAPYSNLSFLKEAELDFYGLQSLFRNELFVPGKKALKGSENLLTGTRVDAENAQYSYKNRQLQFKFLVELASALVKQVKVGSAQGSDVVNFSWDYDTFQSFGGRMFPTHHKVSLSGAHGFEANIVLSNLSNDSKWETRTTVKNSYTRLDAETMISKLLQLK